MSVLSFVRVGAASACLLAPAVMAAPFQNGSFELFEPAAADLRCHLGISYCGQYNAGNSGINGWVIGGNSVDEVGPLAWAASAGSSSIDLSGADIGSISQTFDTLAGTIYRVTFDLGGNFYGGPALKTGTVSAASATQNFSFNNIASTASAMGWLPQLFTFTAAAASTTLSFISTTAGSAGPAIDNVTVSVVPEPSTWLLWLAGGLSLAAYARRR